MRFFALLLVILLGPAAAAAAGPSPPLLCRRAILAAEQAMRIPDQFLSAIGRVETGRPDPDTGGVSPWPWTVNAEGEGHYYATRQEAIAAVQALQARGVRSIDVGCLQVNLMHHPDAFPSLDAAFDPATNTQYAARLLLRLFHDKGSWPHAAAAYHSQTPSIGADYQQKVLAEWARPQGPDPDGHPGDGGRDGGRGGAASAYAALGPSSAAASRSGPLGAVPMHLPFRTSFQPPSGLVRRLTIPGGPPGAMARDLASYRAAPVALAFAPRRPG